MRPITPDLLLCPCCKSGYPNARLLAALNEMQTQLGTELQITSGCRCPLHNADVGGAAQSHHLTGNAADVAACGISPLALYLAAEQVYSFRNGGIGLYPQQYIHLDTRMSRARWYRVAGKDHAITEYLTHANAT